MLRSEERRHAQNITSNVRSVKEIVLVGAAGSVVAVAVVAAARVGATVAALGA